MARRRFFVPSIHDGMAELRGDSVHHLIRVLRAEPGRQYEISDNQAVYLAELVEARPDRAVFRVLEPLPASQLPVRLTLCAALIKFDRFEWIVEKATELGVERIIPFHAARTDKGLFEAAVKRAGRWERIALESSQQSRRLRVPAIDAPVRFEQALAFSAAHRYFLDEAGAPPLPRALSPAPAAAAEAALLVGPEGGWTEAERQAAGAAGWTPASLGPQILRAETAALAALAVLITGWAGV